MKKQNKEIENIINIAKKVFNKNPSATEDNLVEALKEYSEEARQSGYEVGYAQAETDNGMPKPMIDFIKEDEKKETREQMIKEFEKLPVGLFDSTPYLEKFIKKLRGNENK